MVLGAACARSASGRKKRPEVQSACVSISAFRVSEAFCCPIQQLVGVLRSPAFCPNLFESLGFTLPDEIENSHQL